MIGALSACSVHPLAWVATFLYTVWYCWREFTLQGEGRGRMAGQLWTQLAFSCDRVCPGSKKTTSTVSVCCIHTQRLVDCNKCLHSNDFWNQLKLRWNMMSLYQSLGVFINWSAEPLAVTAPGRINGSKVGSENSKTVELGCQHPFAKDTGYLMKIQRGPSHFQAKAENGASPVVASAMTKLTRPELQTRKAMQATRVDLLLSTHASCKVTWVTTSLCWSALICANYELPSLQLEMSWGRNSERETRRQMAWVMQHGLLVVTVFIFMQNGSIWAAQRHREKKRATGCQL